MTIARTPTSSLDGETAVVEVPNAFPSTTVTATTTPLPEQRNEGDQLPLPSPPPTSPPPPSPERTPLWVLLLNGLFAVIGGFGGTFAVSLAATLTAYTGNGIRSALANFTTASALLCFLVVVTREWKKLDRTKVKEHVRWWFPPIPGFIGSTAVTFGVIMVGLVSYSTFGTFAIGGQLIASAVIDHFGIAGTTVDRATILKSLCLVLLLGGAVCAQGFTGPDADTPTWKVILYAVLCVLAGVPFPIQAIFNRNATQYYNSSLLAVAVSFTFGAFFLGIASGISYAVSGPAKPLSESEWFNWLGGFCGTVYVLSTTIAPRYLGTGLFFGCVVFGQLLMAILLDAFSFLPGAKTKDLTALRVAGIVVVFLSVMGLKILKYIQEGRKAKERAEQESATNFSAITTALDDETRRGELEVELLATPSPLASPPPQMQESGSPRISFKHQLNTDIML